MVYIDTYYILIYNINKNDIRFKDEEKVTINSSNSEQEQSGSPVRKRW